MEREKAENDLFVQINKEMEVATSGCTLFFQPLRPGMMRKNWCGASLHLQCPSTNICSKENKDDPFRPHTHTVSCLEVDKCFHK